MTPKTPKRQSGWLRCSRCSKTHQIQQGSQDPATWPMHRCGFEVRPFDTWADEDPKEPLAKRSEDSEL